MEGNGPNKVIMMWLRDSCVTLLGYGYITTQGQMGRHDGGFVVIIGAQVCRDYEL